MLLLTPAEEILVKAFRAGVLGRLRERAVTVYLALLKRMPLGDARYVTIEELSLDTQLSPRTVQFAVLELGQRKLVDRKWHGDARGCLCALRDPMDV